MDNLNSLDEENWKQLVLYYKNKTVELEWSFLLSQITYQKNIKQKIDEYEVKIKDQKTFFKDNFDDAVDRLKIQIESLNKEIIKKDKEIQKLKNKKIK